jgi:hypothetical protein
MTEDRDFKRLVRERAARTGESYQRARQQLRPPHYEASPPVGRGQAQLVEAFWRTGIVKLTGVFSEESAAAMREAVWQGWADTYGVRRDDRSTWSAVPAFKTVKAAKRHPSFLDVLGEDLRTLADVLIGPGWSTANGFGNLLASFPNADRWHLPGADGLWHSDFLYRTAMDPLPGLRVFAVFGDVPPGGGGTLLVEGSHLMVERFVRERPELAMGRAKTARAACHTSNDWLHELTHGDGHDPTRPQRFMTAITDIDGIPAQVIEACGRPGDVYVCHPWTIHCAPPNANDQPRFLRSPTLSHRRRPQDETAEQ